MRKSESAQSAMEYLMTYGWAILIIAIILAVLYQLGVFGSASVISNACLVQPGYSCQNPALAGNGLLLLKLGYVGSSSITITAAACTTSNGQPTFTSLASPLTMQSGQVSNFSFSCTLTSNSIGTPFSGYIWIEYNQGSESGLQAQLGTIQTTVTRYGAPPPPPMSIDNTNSIEGEYYSNPLTFYIQTTQPNELIVIGTNAGGNSEPTVTVDGNPATIAQSEQNPIWDNWAIISYYVAPSAGMHPIVIANPGGLQTVYISGGAASVLNAGTMGIATGGTQDAPTNTGAITPSANGFAFFVTGTIDSGSCTTTWSASPASFTSLLAYDVGYADYHASFAYAQVTPQAYTVGTSITGCTPLSGPYTGAASYAAFTHS